MKRYVLTLAIVASCFLTTDVQAASLFGKVIEVNSGDVLTVFNLNRPVRVKLLGVDAPEMNQAFGDVAKKHLADLVLDKSVLVEYSGIEADSSLSGRVLLNNSDIGAQMIRDGAAWFDPNNMNRLGVTDRDVYQHSEQAARNERRGLWQQENPVAPWKFVKAENFRSDPMARLESVAPKTKRDGPVPELTNMTLLASAITRSTAVPVGESGGRSGGVEPNIKNNFLMAMSATPKTWQRFRPAGENFSVLMPEDGTYKTIKEPAGDRMVAVHSYGVRDGWGSYVVTWMTGPSFGEADRDALQSSLQGMLKGMSEAYGRAGGQQQVSCGAIPEVDISSNGYAGTEFDLNSCTLPGKARAYTRIIGAERQLYFAAVFYLEEEENVSRFLKSFTLVQDSKTKKRK